MDLKKILEQRKNKYNSVRIPAYLEYEKAQKEIMQRISKDILYGNVDKSISCYDSNRQN